MVQYPDTLMLFKLSIRYIKHLWGPN